MVTGMAPFTDRNRKQILNNIISCEPIMKPYFSKELKNLLLGLLNKDVFFLYNFQ